MTATPDDLFAYLDELGVAHTTHWHDAVFTVDEGRELKASMPGGHTKNLFLTDKDGAIILIAAEAHSELKLNRLHRLIGTRRLSFGSPDLMDEVLGVTPGSVTAFALMNDTGGRVRFLVDAALLEEAETREAVSTFALHRPRPGTASWKPQRSLLLSFLSLVLL